MEEQVSHHSVESVLTAVQSLFSAAEAPVALFDESDRIRYANLAFRYISGVDPASRTCWTDMIRQNHAGQGRLAIETEDVEQWIEQAQCKRWQLPYREFEVDLIDGRWLRFSETRVAGVGLLLYGLEITDNKLQEDRLQQEYQRALAVAETDALTGLGNRRLLDRLAAALTRKAGKSTMSALMIDIDFFKPYNDSLGHFSGDNCLRRIAGVIQGSLRSGRDTALRIGGEEFLVLMHGTRVEAAMQVAERIRQSVEDWQMPHPDCRLGYVTVSLGVASAVISDARGIPSLLQAADKALYQAKGAGRNRVVRI